MVHRYIRWKQLLQNLRTKPVRTLSRRNFEDCVRTKAKATDPRVCRYQSTFMRNGRHEIILKWLLNMKPVVSTRIPMTQFVGDLVSKQNFLGFNLYNNFNIYICRTKDMLKYHFLPKGHYRFQARTCSGRKSMHHQSLVGRVHQKNLREDRHPRGSKAQQDRSGMVFQRGHEQDSALECDSCPKMYDLNSNHSE